MVDGTPTQSIEKAVTQRTSLGRLAKQDGSQLRNKAQKKHLRFVPSSIVTVVGTGARGEMDAQDRRPLPPPDPYRELLSLPPKTGLDRGRRCHTWAKFSCPCGTKRNDHGPSSPKGNR